MGHMRLERVTDFENAKMDRRRLIKALGAGAAAAFAASAVPKAMHAFAANSAPAGKGLVKATAVNHLSYAVADYARARDFYVDLFGMKLAWDDGKKCSVEFGDPAKPDALYLVPAKPGEKPNVGHIAFSIENFMARKNALEGEFKRLGLKYRTDTEWGWTADDPTGYMLNIVAEKGIYPGAASPCEVMASEKCKAADQAGLQEHLAKAPKPSGKGFKATAFSHIVLCVPDIAKSRDFYKEMFGMQVIYEKHEEPNAQCMLRFGSETLYLRNIKRPDHKPYVDHFAFEIENYNQDAVEAELKRRGFNPQPDSKLGWTIQDPEGMRIEVAAKGLPEHIARDCNGRAADCPGGSRG